MKSLILSVALLAASTSGFAQGVFTNNTNAVLSRVIKDYPNRFTNIRGELIKQGGQTSAYKSNVQLPGSSYCIIKHNVALKNDEWACTAFESDDFAEASAYYSKIFDQIHNTIIKIDGEKPFILNGQFEAPETKKKINRIQFDLIPAVGNIKKLKIDLMLLQESGKWKIQLSVYDGDGVDEGKSSITAG